MHSSRADADPLAGGGCWWVEAVRRATVLPSHPRRTATSMVLASHRSVGDIHEPELPAGAGEGGVTRACGGEADVPVLGLVVCW